MPTILIVLAIGPARIANAWRGLTRSLFDGKHEPADVLDRVVRQHRQHINALKAVIDQAESARGDVDANRHKSVEALEPVVWRSPVSAYTITSPLPPPRKRYTGRPSNVFSRTLVTGWLSPSNA